MRISKKIIIIITIVLILQTNFLQVMARTSEEWVIKGITLEREENYIEAITCYDKATELSPDNIMAWYYKGNALEKLKNHTEAIACYDKAIALNPDYADAWLL